MENHQIRFGHIRKVAKNVEETREIDFVISDASKDRHRTVLSVDGWDLDPYNRNGLVGYQHNVYGGGICSGPDPDSVIGKGFAFVDERELIGRTTFEPKDINPLAEKIFRKLLFGSLSSTSVGFSEVERGIFGDDDEAEGKQNETYYFGRRELLEYSIVNIPSNRNTQKRGAFMRDHTAGALAYVMSELGDKLRTNQILNLRVCDVLDLLDGKDIDIRSTDPDEVRRLLQENEAQAAQIQRLTAQVSRYKNFVK